MELTKKNSGKLRVSEDELTTKVANNVTSMITHISEQSRSNTVTRKNSDVTKIHSPNEIILSHEKNKQQSLTKNSEKERKKKEREEREIIFIERRIRNKCIIEGCKRVRQSSTDWLVCNVCNNLICPPHKKSKAEHESQCINGHLQ